MNLPYAEVESTKAPPRAQVTRCGVLVADENATDVIADARGWNTFDSAWPWPRARFPLLALLVGMRCAVRSGRPRRAYRHRRAVAFDPAGAPTEIMEARGPTTATCRRGRCAR